MRYTRTSFRRRGQISLVLVLAALSSSLVSSFGIISKAKTALRQMTSVKNVSEIAEAVNGETYPGSALEGEGSLNETDLLVSEENTISPNAPALTYEKFLTMQSKRVPVAIRYSAEAGLKPYFLTVAKKIKEAHPDVVLEKVILPKVQMSESESKNDIPTFEVKVDGKVVVPTLGRKDRSMTSSDSLCVFVSMQELDNAILRARRRRRPSTVYGEDANVRFELLKYKAEAARHSKD